MKSHLRKRMLQWFLVAGGLCLVLCTALYFLQEKLIFFPQKLPGDYRFFFDPPFEEVNLPMQDGKKLNGLLFRAGSPSKGLLFYLHGNAGSLASWGRVAAVYTGLGYDVFLLDYRGYGKSEGSIRSEAQLLGDVQTAYDAMLRRYPEEAIVVLGYSIGSGLAARLAADNHPRLLILQAPYYSLKDLVRHLYPAVPSFLLKYPLRTDRALPRCKMPVVLFHGTADETIYYGSSEKLRRHFKPGDTLIALQGQGHNGMSDNADYRRAVEAVLR